MSVADIPKKKITWSGLREAARLFKYIRPYSLQYGIGLFFLLGSSLANLAFPKLLGDLVNAGNTGNIMNELNRIGLALGGILMIQAVFSYFRIVTFVNVSEKALADLRQDTFNHLIRLPVRFFDKRRVGELNSRLSSDISLLQETLTSTLAEFIRQIIIIIGGIALLIITSGKLTLFMLAVLPAVVLLSVYFGRFIRSYSQKAQKEVADSNTIVEETLQGIKSVKAYTNEPFEAARYRDKTIDIANIGIKGGKYRGAFSSFLIFGLFGAMVAVIWRGATLLASGDINAGQLFSFVLYSGFIGGTIGGLANVFTRIQRFLGATEDLFSIFEEEAENILPEKKLRPEEVIRGDVKFEGVAFQYPNRSDETVLANINFTIPANRLTAIVGPSGAGKSTVTSLLMGFYKPSEGGILFDGKPSEQFSLSAIRKQIALVPQDIFLFGGTIRENIAYGKPGASEEQILDAAEKANALEFISQFPQKLDTIVGERGTQLSGGQRQRIAIARAILKNPGILILDEATSSLDSESEKLVQDALEKLMKGRTSVVIAHRLSTIRKADQILVLEQGMIVETGTHHELIKLPNGIYRNLSELQFAG
ncbi:MAG: ABC transporter transmembrane domain-containing protein [Bacteroidales bacterium]